MIRDFLDLVFPIPETGSVALPPRKEKNQKLWYEELGVLAGGMEASP
jgi:hypothetical protein